VPEIKIIFLALAVSLDGFGVGMACGIRRLKILFPSLLVICLMSAGAVGVSMLLGTAMGHFISPDLAPKGGGVILLLLGIHFTRQSIKDLNNNKLNNNEQGATGAASGDLVNTGGEKRGWSGILQVAREPVQADRDCSGTLSAGEALGLGAALAADAFGAGFGAVLVGLNPVITVVAVGLTKLILVPAGFLLGHTLSFSFLGKFAPLLSGLMLFLLGCWSLI